MQCLFLDFETYWSDDFTLKQMTPVEYIMDPRFEALGCAFVKEDGSAGWVDGPHLEDFFRTVNWSNTLAISHNALFDMLILSMRYGVTPGMYGCTLSMARNHLAHKLKSLSLASVSGYYGMSEKMDTAQKFKGLSFSMIKAMPWLHEEMKQYGADDAQKCRALFRRMLLDERFPPQELHTIDWVVRMAANPKFIVDQTVLSEHLHEIQAKKQALLDQAYLEEPSSIMSDPQLAVKLMTLGVRPIPMKVSKRTGKKAWAFAKSDKEFTALLEHDSPMVQALVAARLGHKSTLEESRTERLLAIGRAAPALPVPLKYSGAHTHRFSGDWKINLQNLPRGGELRRALRAPKGKVVIAVDASQIEARINAELAGETKLVEAFREGRDVYCEFAELIYHEPIDKYRHRIERFVGKTSILSLGYGSSWPVFQNMCRIQGDVKLQDFEAAAIVKLYRDTYRKIVSNWYHANGTILPMIAHGGEYTWGPVKTEKYAIVLPDGNKLRYRDLRHELYEDTYQWQFMRGTMPQRIYGAKVVENVVQALAFIHIKEVAMRVKALTKGLLIPAHQVHDELIYVEELKVADMVLELVKQEMARSPLWMPDLPLAAEGEIGDTYYDAKS